MTDRWTFADLDSLRERFFAISPQPTDPVGWLRGELDFVEHIARSTRQASLHWDDWSMDGELRDRENSGEIARVARPEDRAHMMLWDPASALRQVEAERELLDEHAEDPHDPGYCTTCTVGEEGWSGPVAARRPCRTLLLRAKAWGWKDEQHG